MPQAGLSHTRNGSYTFYNDVSPNQMPPVSSSVNFPNAMNQTSNRPQGYSQFGSGVVYSMPQPSTPATSYDASQGYVSRDSSDAIHVLSSHFAGVPPPFYPSAEQTHASPVASQHTPVSRYDPMSFSQSSSISQINYQPNYTPTLQEMTPQTQGGLQDQAYERNRIDEAYNEYKEGIRRTFTHIRNGNLVDGSQALLDVSTWLLTNAVELGIVRDEQEVYNERIKMWDEFNHCWLAVLQKQKDVTINMLESTLPAMHSVNLIPEDFLEKLGQELVRLCDGMERHGLVDYQMGVWEEQILDLLTECITLLQPDEEEEGDDQDEPATAAISK
ncbi:MAG: hypothetical protein M1814_003501 [Vezdaea aestivalis]|nr:MAG: hypothetical protein M1814_003501 [Vezdaea aestivalis]